MVAAAAVLLVASTAVVALRGGPGDVGPATVRPGPSGAGSSAEDPALQDPADGGADSNVVASPGPVPEGWRSVTFRDVAVAVPGEWGDGVAPDESWCADSGGATGSGAYVAVDSTLLVTALIACGSSEPLAPEGFGPDPEAGWLPHLRFADLARAGTSPLEDGSRRTTAGRCGCAPSGPCRWHCSPTRPPSRRPRR